MAPIMLTVVCVGLVCVISMAAIGAEVSQEWALIGLFLPLFFLLFVNKYKRGTFPYVTYLICVITGYTVKIAGLV